MVWNDIFAWINGNMAEIGVTFLGLLEAVKMVGNRLNFNKVYNSTVAPITSSNNVVFNKVALLTDTVDKLIGTVQDLKSSNISKDTKIEQLSNLVVSLASVANVPLSAKEAFFNGIVKAKVVTDESSLALQKMIEAKQRQDSTTQLVNDEAINALKNGA